MRSDKDAQAHRSNQIHIDEDGENEGVEEEKQNKLFSSVRSFNRALVNSARGVKPDMFASPEGSHQAR